MATTKRKPTRKRATKTTAKKRTTKRPARKKKSAPQKQGKSRERVGRGNPPKEHQFKPGQSGNPGGRPKGKSLKHYLTEILQEEVPVKVGKRTVRKVAAKAIVDSFIENAAKGSVQHGKVVWERAEGKVKEDEMAGAPGASEVAEARTMLHRKLEQLLEDEG